MKKYLDEDTEIGNMCYCYNRECNEQFEKKFGLNYKATHIAEYKLKSQKTPKCPYCKKSMTVTANIDRCAWW